MSDQLKLILYLKNMISDLVYINSVMATELVKINENLAALRHGEDFLKNSKCIHEHSVISEHIISIVEKYNKADQEILRKQDLERHVTEHE